jgi:peptidoglycan/LPS O-acetylase OafA/YrhL
LTYSRLRSNSTRQRALELLVSTGKVDSLTGIRGLAALWVAWFHFSSYPDIGAIDLGRIVTCGYWGVDVFFVLSGLVLAMNYAPRFATRHFDWRAFGAFLGKRIARIYPLHLATFLLVFVFWKFAMHTGQAFPLRDNNNRWTELSNVLLIHAWGVAPPSFNAPSWSVSAEWFAYLFVFPVCVAGLRRLSAPFCLAVAGVLWLAFVAYVFCVHDGVLALVTADGIVRIIPEFVGGYALYRLAIHQRPGRGSWALVAGLAAIVALAYLPNVTVILLFPAIMLLMFGLYSGGALVEAIFANRLAMFLGEISYSIYMVHIIVAAVANHLIRLAGVTPTIPHAVMVLLGETLLTMALAFLAYRYIEVPGRALVGSKLGRLSPATVAA